MKILLKKNLKNNKYPMKNYKKKIYEATKKPFKTNSAMKKKELTEFSRIQK
ncbi:MAG: hypothetical protein KKF16_07930 [Euryarchaeota archaeon]|nr:hypothetical protein [Euryarchaeota archaeon]MBU4608769.1 hypothetical protein [Euryarchaeota archaeon]MBV1767534.1 hypothetical protein [Methanobacterium sp.]